MTRRMLGALVAVIAVAFGTTAVAIGGVPHQKDSNSVFKYSGNVSDSVDPQNADNDVVKFDTTDPTVVDSMGRKLSETVAQVTDQIELKYFFVGTKDCNGGSPRIDLFVDTNGDHKFDNGDTVLRGDIDPSSTGQCAKDKWQYLDLANLGDNTPRWSVNNANTNQPWSAIVAQFGPQDILFGQLVDDAQSFRPENQGIAYYDLVSIGNRTFVSHEDAN